MTPSTSTRTMAPGSIPHHPEPSSRRHSRALNCESSHEQAAFVLGGRPNGAAGRPRNPSWHLGLDCASWSSVRTPMGATDMPQQHPNEPLLPRAWP
jgi:hypothetical protein